MDEIRKKAKKDYMSGMKYQEICDKYDLSMNTLKSWVKRHGWSAEKKRRNQKGAHKRKRGAPLNNRNAVGNKGGAAPKGNKNAEKHGFFSKYLPEETLAILQEIQEKDPLDMLWDNITIQYTAIIRAQKLMYVRDQDDKTIERVGYKTGKIKGEDWEVQQAWDKHATFLKAQSRAMSELRNMIRQYDELLKGGLATEEQKARIAKLKAEASKMEADSAVKSPPVINIVDAWAGKDKDS